MCVRDMFIRILFILYIYIYFFFVDWETVYETIHSKIVIFVNSIINLFEAIDRQRSFLIPV